MEGALRGAGVQMEAAGYREFQEEKGSAERVEKRAEGGHLEGRSLPVEVLERDSRRPTPWLLPRHWGMW